MRDRLSELLPLLLVAVVLVIVQLSRSGAPGVPFAGNAAPTVTPAPPPTAAAKRAVADPSTPPVTACNPGQPRFTGGMALLRATLGAAMGDPLDCEAVIDGSGNKEQRTTTGLAYYLKRRDANVFTNGYDHWAVLPDGGLVHWSGDAVDPPE